MPPHVSPAAGAFLGAVGATGSSLRWYNRIADTTDTTANITVAITTIVGFTFGSFKFKLNPPLGFMTLILGSAILFLG